MVDLQEEQEAISRLHEYIEHIRKIFHLHNQKAATVNCIKQGDGSNFNMYEYITHAQLSLWQKEESRFQECARAYESITGKFMANHAQDHLAIMQHFRANAQTLESVMSFIVERNRRFSALLKDNLALLARAQGRFQQSYVGEIVSLFNTEKQILDELGSDPKLRGKLVVLENSMQQITEDERKVESAPAFNIIDVFRNSFWLVASSAGSNGLNLFYTNNEVIRAEPHIFLQIADRWRLGPHGIHVEKHGQNGWLMLSGAGLMNDATGRPSGTIFCIVFAGQYYDLMREAFSTPQVSGQSVRELIRLFPGPKHYCDEFLRIINTYSGTGGEYSRAA